MITVSVIPSKYQTPLRAYIPSWWRIYHHYGRLDWWPYVPLAEDDKTNFPVSHGTRN
jgi:hypothetical protein